jgi:hypothetical protein
MIVSVRAVALFAIISVVGLSGCSWFNRSATGGGDKSVVGSALGGDPSVTPFRLDVLNESNDGKKLNIQGQLVSKERRSAKDVIVRLKGVDSQGEERVASHKVVDLIKSGEDLNPSIPTRFSLALPADGLSNYQLEVLWGRDAEPYLGSTRASLKSNKAESDFLALRNLEVHRVPDGSCSSPEECLVSFSIKGEFFNSGKAVINDVVLVAGFTPASKLGLPNPPLENEKRIQVRGMDLAPQGVKPFRLTLEKLLPASDTVAYQPVVRIESFDAN